MKQLREPQNNVAMRSRADVQAEECMAEFDGAEKSPSRKVIDFDNAIVADYKRYEEKMTHVSAPIIAWAAWTIFCLVLGALFHAASQ